MDQPLVSVVIPAYNCSKTIQRCLDSVLSQNHSALQVVVVDDGSTDDTLARLQAYAARDRPPDRGASGKSGRVRGKKPRPGAVRGKYVQFVDSDDSLAPEAVRHMVLRAEQDDSDLVIGAFTMYIGNISEVKDLGRARGRPFPGGLFVPAVQIPQQLLLWGFVEQAVPAGADCRAAGALQQQLEWGEDFDFITRYLVGARRVSYTGGRCTTMCAIPRG